MVDKNIPPNLKNISGYIRKSWISTHIGQYPIPQDWWSRIAEYPWAAQFVEPTSICLDLGCGFNYPFQKFLADNSKLTYAMDVDERIQNTQHNNLIPIVQDITKSWELEENSIDRVFCISVLEHLPKETIPFILSESKRVLKENGLILITFDVPDINIYEFKKIVEDNGLRFYNNVEWTQPEDVIIQKETPSIIGPPNITSFRRVFVASLTTKGKKKMTEKQEWLQAIQWEKQWWEDPNYGTTNSFYEELKQNEIYAERMGLKFDNRKAIPCNGQHILDIGGGPVSMLLKCQNAGRKMVIDPLMDSFPEWVKERYKSAGIDFKCEMGEEIEQKGWDEVWIYNVLQHVMDPKEVLHRAMKSASKLRIFEWVKVGVCDGHLHNLSKEMLDEIIGAEGIEEIIDIKDGTFCTSYHGVFDLENGKIKEKPKVEKRKFSKSDKLTFHIPGIPHTVTNKSFNACAYSMKVLKLSQGLTELGHDVFYYGCEGSDPPCTENVQVITEEYRRKFYPDDCIDKPYIYDTTDELHKVYSQNCAKEIQKRKNGTNDFLLCAWGWGHKPIADILNDRDIITVESGIGYKDTFADFRVFESYTWMQWVYGKDGVDNGKFYDCVIPNFFDINDFEFNDQKEDWFLYIGRVVKRKGVELAVDITKEIGANLVIAGQGTLVNEAEGLNISGDHIQFEGYADIEKRKHLMSKAKALFVPTYYIEPFGGVTIEGFLGGTPAITTDFGIFAETNLHGITGYRCHTREQFIWAANNIGNIKPQNCRDWAVNNFSIERVALMYDEYFHMLNGLRGDGWMMENKERNEMNWLNKIYPSG